MSALADIDDDVKQILYGGLVGSSYICKGTRNDYLCMRHSERHRDWLKAKAAELYRFASKKPFYQYNSTMTWRSTCHPVFSELRKEIYQENEKVITMKWLDRFRDLAVAVWFGDSGCMIGRGQKNACLRTQSFGKEGNLIIEKYFNEVGIPCSTNKYKDSYMITFSLPGTRNLFEVVANTLLSPKLVRLPPFENI